MNRSGGDELHSLNQLEELGPLSQDQLLRRKEIKGELKKKTLLEKIKWKQHSRKC